MKKALALTCAMTMAASLFLTGCGGNSSSFTSSTDSNSDSNSGSSNGSGKRVVNVCSWGEYIDEDLIYQFEDETGIKVNYQTAESNEALYSLLKTGAGDYDVIVPSDYMIARLIDEDMLAELNYDNIPNYAKIGDQYKSLSFDPDNKYTVPYTWGTLGIIYNTTMVDGDITSWDAMFDEKYAGNVLMIRNSRDALAAALLDLGYDINTTDESQIQEAYELLADAKSKGVYQSFVMDEVFGKMEGGNAAIAMYYAGDYLTMLDNNPDLKFVVPKRAATGSWTPCAFSRPPSTRRRPRRGSTSSPLLNPTWPTWTTLATLPPIWRHWRAIPLTTRRPTASLWTRSAMRSWPLPLTCWPAASCIPTSPPTR